MSNSYYNHTTYPTPNSPGSSATLRLELQNITAGFALLPTLAANGYKVAMVNSAGTAMIASAALQSLAITLSTINSTSIGATTPSTGAFTTLTATTFTGAVVGNASTATALATARTIGGTSFDGTANVASFPVPGAIGAATPSTAAFTTVSATGHVTFEGVTSTGASGTGKLVFDTSSTLSLTAGTVATTPTAGTDIANKLYVDTVAQGLNTKAAVINATTSALTATYLNGTLGVGATLTNSGTNAAFAADGITNSVSDRVLIKDQASTFQNGIYTVTTAGSVSVPWVLTRATDNDTWAEVPSGYVFISTGTTLADTGWVCSSDAGGTIGTTAITWSQFGGVGGLSSINFGTTGLTPATPASGAVTVAGTLAVANGGTGLTSGTSGGVLAYTASGALASSALLTQYGVVYGGGAGAAPVATANGTTGQAFIATTGGAPSWGTLSIAGGGTNSTAAATAGGVGYGTGTAHAYTAASTGGYILTSGGAGAPAFIQTLPIANGGTNATTAAAALVSLGNRTSATGAEIIPAGTTAQRDASPVVGYLRYNSTTSEFEGYGGAAPAWASVGGSAISNDTTTATNLYPAFLAATTGTAASIYTSNAQYLYKPSTGELSVKAPRASNGIVVNSATIAENYTIATGDNAMSAGPITVNSGVSVTVSSGSRWVVL